MKILSVGKNARGGMFDDAMIDRTLHTSKFGDDYINDTTFISVKVQLENDDDYRAFLFRRLWECIFLKARQYSFIVDGEEGIALLKISLSEAIRMIHTMTPPALSNKLSEFTMSIDHICTFCLTHRQQRTTPIYLSRQSTSDSSHSHPIMM